MPRTPALNIAEPAFKANPYPTYARLRAEAPVCRIRFGRWFEAWLVTRYDDVVTTLRDERFTKDGRKAKSAGARGAEMWLLRVTAPITRNLFALDPPDHTRLRGLVQKAFTARLVEALRPRIEALTEELLDRVARQGGMEVIRDYALPLPITIITEMLGVPASDRRRFQRWTAAVTDVRGVPQVLRAVFNGLKFLRYNRKLTRLRRRAPADDLLTSLIAAEEAGERLDEGELLNMIYVLLVAGYETTANLIGNGTLALLENPAAMERLRAQPSLMPTAVEELMRYDSPVELASARWTLCDVALSGVTIPQGDLVWAGIGSANRDPQQFDDPDGLDLAREPNRHLSFGQGIHYCVGAPLARLEAQIAFSTLLRRFPELRLAGPRHGLRWRKSPLLRGLTALPVAFGESTAVAATSGS